jgi:hypothetical protein
VGWYSGAASGGSPPPGNVSTQRPWPAYRQCPLQDTGPHKASSKICRSGAPPRRNTDKNHRTRRAMSEIIRSRCSAVSGHCTMNWASSSTLVSPFFWHRGHVRCTLRQRHGILASLTFRVGQAVPACPQSNQDIEALLRVLPPAFSSFDPRTRAPMFATHPWAWATACWCRLPC